MATPGQAALSLDGELIQDFRRLVRERARRELGVFLGHPRVRVTQELLYLE